MRPVRLIALFLLATMTACAKSDAGAAKPDGWDGFVSAFLDQYFALRPDIAVNAGRHEFDGRLPDWSPDGLARWGGFLDEQREKALAFDSAGLDGTRRFERDYVVARIDRDLWWLRSPGGPHKNPTYSSHGPHP